MDFLNPSKKRAHRIRLLVGYVLMAILLGFATVILVFQAYGYDLDRSTGSVIQNGLVFVDAHPEAAAIYLNGKQHDRTAQRLVLPAGQYHVELKSDGYRPWQRSIMLAGGGIQRLVYPLLFPEKLEPSSIELLAALPTLTTQSPDRRWLLLQDAARPGQFKSYDLNADVPLPTTLSFSDSLFSPGSAHTYKLVEWSTDNRHLLVEHQFNASQREFVVLDQQSPGNSFNVNKLLSVGPTQVTLRDKKFDEFYIYQESDRSLSTANARDRVVTKAVSEVISFKSHGDDELIYVAVDGAVPGKVKVMIRQNGTTYTLRQLPAGGAYLLDAARFDGAWYYVLGTPSENKVYVYKDPVDFIRRSPLLNPAPIAVLKVTQPASVNFSNNTRFIAVQGVQQFAVYDAEQAEQFEFNIAQPFANSQASRWMDGHRLINVSGGKLLVFDFDGTNIQTLVPAEPISSAFFDHEYTSLYTIAPAPSVPGRFELFKTSLKAKL